MFEGIVNFFKKLKKTEKVADSKSKDTAKERLHLVLMQDRANVSADFLELMRQEIIEVIKKYVDADESAIDVKLINKTNSDGTIGAPALYANIPIVSIKDESRKITMPKQENKNTEEALQKEDIQEEVKKAEEVIEKAGQLEQNEDANKETEEETPIEEGKEESIEETKKETTESEEKLEEQSETKDNEKAEA